MISATIDNASMQSLNKAMARAMNETGRSPKNALRWGAYTLCVTLAKRTKKSPKKRKVITNSEGIKGVMIYQSSRIGTTERFLPLTAGNVQYRQFTGNGGVKMVQIFPSGRYMTLLDFNRMSLLSLKSSLDIVNIKHSGMAKESWFWMSKNVGRNSTGNVSGVPNVSSVAWVDKPFGGMSITLTNKLDYIVSAMKNGMASVNEAIYKAGRSIERQIDKGVKEALQKA